MIPELSLVTLLRDLPATSHTPPDVRANKAS